MEDIDVVDRRLILNRMSKKEWNVLGWIHLASDMDQYRAVVNIIIVCFHKMS